MSQGPPSYLKNRALIYKLTITMSSMHLKLQRTHVEKIDKQITRYIRGYSTFKGKICFDNTLRKEVVEEFFRNLLLPFKTPTNIGFSGIHFCDSCPFFVSFL